MTKEVRCPNCNRKLCDASSDAELKVVCNRCKTPYTYPYESNKIKYETT